MPKADLLAQADVAKHTGTSWDDDDLRGLARDYCVSEEVVLRRLLDLGKTSRAFYVQKRAEYQQRAVAAAASAVESSGGPRVSVKVLAKLGGSFVRMVLAGHSHGFITFSEVSDLLGAKVKHVPEIEAALAARA